MCENVWSMMCELWTHYMHFQRHMDKMDNVGYWLVWGYTIVSPDSKIIVYPEIVWGVHYCVPRIFGVMIFFIFLIFFSF